MMSDKAPSAERPIIGLIMGDVAGIGPEIIVKTLAKEKVYRICRPVVVGDLGETERSIGMISSKLKINPVKEIADAVFKLGTIDVLDMANVPKGSIEMGRVNPVAGKASMEFIKKGVSLAMEGKVDSIVLAPLSKEAMYRAGFKHADETGFLAELTNAKRAKIVVKLGSIFRTTVVGHVPFRNIVDHLTKEEIAMCIRLLHQTIRNICYPRLQKPKIAVAALNPHGGEGGLLGTEEIEIIKPAVESGKESGINVEGPFLADSVFLRAMRGEFDGVVFMYHDQGNIAMKPFGFGKSALIYVGIPIICTGPTHGVAYDIAGKGTADTGSYEEALKLAAYLTKNRCGIRE